MTRKPFTALASLEPCAARASHGLRTARASLQLCAALAWLGLSPAPALAEIYQCVDDAGRVTYVNDRSACPDAKPHALEGHVDRVPSASGRVEAAVPDPAAISTPEKRLEWALLSERDVRPNWEVVEEMPEDPTRDADLVEWGVVAQRTRHYTRQSGGASQVCSIELWAFENTARARLAEQNFAFPDWRIDRRGDTLVMLRAVTVRQDQTDRTIYPDCEKLGVSVRARAAKFAEE